MELKRRNSHRCRFITGWITSSILYWPIRLGFISLASKRNNAYRTYHCAYSILLVKEKSLLFPFHDDHASGNTSYCCICFANHHHGTFAPSTSRTACCRLHRTQQDVELLAIHPCLFLDDNDCRRNRSSSTRTLFMAQTSRDYKSFGLVYRSNHRHTRLCRHAKTKNVLRKGAT